MERIEDDLVVQIHRQEVERMRREGGVPPLPPYEPPTIPYSELPEAKPGETLYHEWNLYRHIIGQLLADGHEGKWLLIKNEEVIGIWDTQSEANVIRQERFLMPSVLMKQILAREPLYHLGYNRLCRS